MQHHCGSREGVNTPQLDRGQGRRPTASLRGYESMVAKKGEG